MNIKLNLHKNQYKIFNDGHRFKVVCCGRRFGKTTLAIITLIIKALEADNGLFWYVSPTYRQSKQIAWELLQSKLRELPAELIRKRPNETELSVTIGNNSRIQLKGADNPDSLRGVGLNGIVMDEYASMSPKVFEEIIRPTLTDTMGWALFIGTPKGFNHFYDLMNIKDTDYSVYRFTSYDNPFLFKEEIDKAKEELTDDAFAQEYLADFRKFTGLVYKDFNRNKHIVQPFLIDQSWTRYIGIDFGAANPTGVVFVCCDNNQNWFVYDEIYEKESGVEKISEMIKARIIGLNISGIFGDPSGKIIMQEYQLKGIPVVGGNNEMIGGISKINEYLKPSLLTGKPRLKVFKTCPNLIREFENYHYSEKKNTLNAQERPVKEHDHLLDALRYVLFTISETPKELTYDEWSPRRSM